MPFYSLLFYNHHPEVLFGLKLDRMGEGMRWSRHVQCSLSGSLESTVVKRMHRTLHPIQTARGTSVRTRIACFETDWTVISIEARGDCQCQETDRLWIHRTALNRTRKPFASLGH